VTGGSRGVGAGIAAAFAREGARVAFTYRERDERAAETLRRIEGFGVEGATIRADVASADDCLRAVAETVGRFGRINVLVNNAGAIGRSCRSGIFRSRSGIDCSAPTCVVCS